MTTKNPTLLFSTRPPTTASKITSSLLQADIKLVGPLSVAVVGDIASVPRIDALNK